MAFTDLTLPFDADPIATPRAGRSDWVAAVTTFTAADNASPTNPDTDIAANAQATHFCLKRLGGRGTTLRFRLKYPAASAFTLIFHVFGKANGGWQGLYNKASTPSMDITLTPGTDTYTVGTNSAYRYTNPTSDIDGDHSVDCDNCDEFVLVIKSISGDGGSETVGAEIQAKII